MRIIFLDPNYKPYVEPIASIRFLRSPEEDPFSSAYYRLRGKEGRIYADGAVEFLPWVGAGHPLKKEWVARLRSWNRMRRYLLRRADLKKILDLGCGNGWMTAKLAGLPDTRVWGMDLTLPELEQGLRVFGELPDLEFIYGNIFADRISFAPLDMVVLAASVQYFSDLTALVERLKEIVRPGGEIHIVDSPFYATGEVEAARARSRAYYEKMGFAELGGHYFAHSKKELMGLGAEVLYAADGVVGKLRRVGMGDTPFGWYRVVI